MRRAVRRARRFGQVVALARRLATLGSGVGRLKLFRTTVALGARRMLRRPSGRLRELRVRVVDSARPVVVSDYGEVEVMRDILLDEAYSLEGLPAPATILDVGANIGLAALYFRARYPDALIVAVEPDPFTFGKLERNLRGDSRALLVNAAASDAGGEVVLFRPPGYSIASSMSSARSYGSETRVRARTLDSILDGLGVERVDLLKLDVEGAELEALRGFSRLAGVKAVLGEAHPDLLGEQTELVFAMLDGFEVRRLSESKDSIAFVAVRTEDAA